jgi:ABC-type multidrug transport system ATPase subunit/ABC-type multidrug transport system permease subunit
MSSSPTILEWRNVTVQGRERTNKNPLFEVSGKLCRGRLTCLVGPSGAGKSILLRALSGRVETLPSSQIVLVEADGTRRSLSSSSLRRAHIGFVAGEDSLLSSATPAEALDFSLALRPGKRSANDRMRLVEQFLALLDLETCRDTSYAKLSSLNQKRFSSIGVEMINERKVLLLDSPLVGLSQLGAYQFIKNLKKFVAQDHNLLSGILCTLLQPSSEVLSMFDDIILMADHGVIVYQGPTDQLPSHFAKFGHVCPPHYNVSDFALFVLHSISPQQREALAAAHKELKIASEEIVPCKINQNLGEKRSVSMQFKYLVVREIKDVFRNWRSTLVTRFVTSVIISLVIGAVYYQIGVKVTINSTSNAIHAYRGCVLVMCCNAMLANAQTVVLSLPQQKSVFKREYSLNMYSSLVYLASKFPMELLLSAIQVFVQLVISYFLCGLQGNFGIYWIVLVGVETCAESIALCISCLTSSVMSAIQTLPIVILPQIIFSGLIVSFKAMPKWISWLQYICFLPYAVKLLCINEFGCASIEQFTSNDIQCSFVMLNGVVLVSISIAFRLVALVALMFEPKSYRSLI